MGACLFLLPFSERSGWVTEIFPERIAEAGHPAEASKPPDLLNGKIGSKQHPAGFLQPLFQDILMDSLPVYLPEQPFQGEIADRKLLANIRKRERLVQVGPDIPAYLSCYDYIVGKTFHGISNWINGSNPLPEKAGKQHGMSACCQARATRRSCSREILEAVPAPAARERTGSIVVA